MGSEVVVITGSTRGLGFAYAQSFLHRGHHVVVSGRRQAAVDEAIDGLEADAVVGGGVAIGQACDVSDAAQVQALWDFAVRSLGPVDIWLHNAGCAASDLAGTMASARVAIAGMSAQRGGGKLFLTVGDDAATRPVRDLADSLVKARRGMRDDALLIGTVSPGIVIARGPRRGSGASAGAPHARTRRGVELLADPVSTTAPWIVERVLAATRQGTRIRRVGLCRSLARRIAGLLARRRDVSGRHPADGDPVDGDG